MAPLYKKALIVGATSGIGEALAAKLVQNGIKVIVSGRRQEALDAFVSKHKDSASSAAVNLVDLPSLPGFAKSVIEKNPDLDCVIINSGIQRPFDFTQPETVDLGILQDEVTTNYIAYVHLIKFFLPHLFQQQGQTHLIVTSSTLGFMPILVRAPNYNATKGALHTFTLNLRQQLKDGEKNVRVVEAFPPATQTELHDTKHQPDLVNGGQIGMPLDACVDEFYAGLERGDPQFGMGPMADYFHPAGTETLKLREFEKGHEQMSGMIKDFVKK